MKDRTALVASFLLDRGVERSRVQEALERGQSGMLKRSNAHISIDRWAWGRQLGGGSAKFRPRGEWFF